MAGYVNYGDTLLNLPRNFVERKLINGKQAKYLIITGESSEDLIDIKKKKKVKMKMVANLKLY